MFMAIDSGHNLAAFFDGEIDGMRRNETLLVVGFDNGRAVIVDSEGVLRFAEEVIHFKGVMRVKDPVFDCPSIYGREACNNENWAG